MTICKSHFIEITTYLRIIVYKTAPQIEILNVENNSESIDLFHYFHCLNKTKPDPYLVILYCTNCLNKKIIENPTALHTALQKSVVWHCCTLCA